MEFRILDFNDTTLTSQDILKVILENHHTDYLMAKEIKKMKSISNRDFIRIDSLQVDDKKTSRDGSNSINEDLKDEVDYYYSLISSIAMQDFSKEKLVGALPRKSNFNYNNIMFSIKLEILKEIKVLQDIFEEEQDNIDLDDINSLKLELDFNRKKIQMIDEISKENNIDDLELRKNNFIFVPTSYGNIRVIDEINKIVKNNPEHIDSFRGLFESITDGSFKGVKRFKSTNNRTSGVSEVRDYQSRVVFDKIGEDDYAIITAFVKKSDNDKGYLEALANKIKSYLQVRDSIIRQLDSDEFRSENELYTASLNKTLEENSPKSKKKV